MSSNMRQKYRSAISELPQQLQYTDASRVTLESHAPHRIFELESELAKDEEESVQKPDSVPTVVQLEEDASASQSSGEKPGMCSNH